MKSVVFTNIMHVGIGTGRHTIATDTRALLLSPAGSDPSRILLTGFGFSCSHLLFNIAALRLAYTFVARTRELRVPGVPTLRLQRERTDDGLDIEITEFENPAQGVVADFIAERTIRYALSPNVLVPVAMKPEVALTYLRRVEAEFGLLPKNLTQPRPGRTSADDDADIRRRSDTGAPR